MSTNTLVESIKNLISRLCMLLLMCGSRSGNYPSHSRGPVWDLHWYEGIFLFLVSREIGIVQLQLTLHYLSNT